MFQNLLLQIIVFALYFLFFTWLITVTPFFKKAGIGKGWLTLMFAIKVAAGILYGFYFSLPQYIATADTWKFYNSSLTETAWLLRDPAGFLKDLFYSPYGQTSSLFSGVNSYWNDLKDNVIIKLMAVINVFTGESYYAGIIFFNFLFLFGPVALYRIAKPFWNGGKVWLTLASFFLPSFLFWCSGIHKDGLIFSAMMISIYCFWGGKKRRFTAKYIIATLLCLLVLFALRNAVLFLLLAAFAAWFVSEKMLTYRWLVFTGLYAIGLLLFFVLPRLSPMLNFPQYIINKQAEFALLTGNSKIKLPPLLPNFKSFASFFLYALDLAFFRPHIGDIKGVNYLLSFLENSFFILALLLWLIWHKPLKTIPPILIFFLFFSLSVWLLCGYTVTFSGAIVRYKSITAPLLLFFILLSVDFTRMGLLKKKFIR